MLEVADDGDGFPIGQAGRLDSYGIIGMRERAASIGATLDVETIPASARGCAAARVSLRPDRASHRAATR